MQKAVAFLGLGVMGYPMAGWLSKHGYAVMVYNRTQAVSQRWLSDYSGTSADTVAEAVSGAEIVFSCLGNDDDVRAVVAGEAGALASMKSGSIFVDHTTTSALLARELAEQAQTLSIGFVDAPVSGGQQGAENGQLTVMCGGQQNHFDAVQRAIQSYAKSLQLMGCRQWPTLQDGQSNMYCRCGSGSCRRA